MIFICSMAGHFRSMGMDIKSCCKLVLNYVIFTKNSNVAVCRRSVTSNVTDSVEFPELRLKYTEKGNIFIFDIDSIKKNETLRSRRDFFSFI